MARRFIISISASNRTGVLASVTNGLSELGGDLVEASVDVICGHFTMLLAADFPDHRKQDVITDHLRDYGQSFGLQILIKEIKDAVSTNQTIQERFMQGKRAFLTAYGNDSPGIARGISAMLSLQSIDIIDMYGIGEVDTNKFAMAMEVTLPSFFNEQTLRLKMSEFERECDITMSFILEEGENLIKCAEVLVREIVNSGYSMSNT